MVSGKRYFELLFIITFVVSVYGADMGQSELHGKRLRDLGPSKKDLKQMNRALKDVNLFKKSVDEQDRALNEYMLEELGKNSDEFYNACVDGDAAKVSQLIHKMDGDLRFSLVNAVFKGELSDGKKSKKTTPLLEAVSRGHTDVARVLLAKGAQLEVPNRFGPTLLEWADHRKDSAMVALLIPHAKFIGPMVPKAVEYGLEVTQALLKKNKKLVLDYRDAVTGNTLAHCAVEKGDAPVLKCLIDAGIDRAVKNKGSKVCRAQTVLQMADALIKKQGQTQERLDIRKILESELEPKAKSKVASAQNDLDDIMRGIEKEPAKAKKKGLQALRDTARHQEKIKQAAIQKKADEELKRDTYIRGFVSDVMATAANNATAIITTKKRDEEAARAVKEKEEARQERLQEIREEREKDERREQGNRERNNAVQEQKRKDLKMSVENFADRAPQEAAASAAHIMEQQRKESDAQAVVQELQDRAKAIKQATKAAEEERIRRIMEDNDPRWEKYRALSGRKAAPAPYSLPKEITKEQVTGREMLVKSNKNHLIQHIRSKLYGIELVRLVAEGADPEEKVDGMNAYDHLLDQMVCKQLDSTFGNQLIGQLRNARKESHEKLAFHKKKLQEAAKKGDKAYLRQFFTIFYKNASVHRLGGDGGIGIINEVNEVGDTPFESAVKAGHFKFANYLAAHSRSAVAKARAGSLPAMLLDRDRRFGFIGDRVAGEWPVSFLRESYRFLPGAKQLVKNIFPPTNTYIPRGVYSGQELYEQCHGQKLPITQKATALTLAKQSVYNRNVRATVS